jgi:type I restriction enzyme, S subunit
MKIKQWETKQLDEVATFSSGGTPSKEEPNYWEGDYPWISAKDMKSFSIKDAGLKLTHEGLAVAKIAKKGSVLVLVRGMTLLKDLPVGYVERDVAFNQDIKSLVAKSGVSGLFLAYAIIANKNRILNLVNVAGHGTGRLDTTLLKEFPIDLPPLLEQCRIAEMLGVWDESIDLLEKLIGRVRSRKQGLMQQLLTGKKRFKEFDTKSSFSIRSSYFDSKLGELPDDWNVVNLPDVLYFQEGPGVQNHQFTQSGVKLLNGSNIQKAELILDNTSRYIDEDEAYGKYKHFLVDAGDLVIASSGISVDKFEDKIAFVAEKDLPLCMNTSTIRFKVKDKMQVNLAYFKYFMMTALFKDQIRRQITGSAQLNFGPTHLNLTLLVLPPLPEQEKIAAVLSAADEEISTLEKQLAAYKQQKLGLMQQLLTGSIRI